MKTTRLLLLLGLLGTPWAWAADTVNISQLPETTEAANNDLFVIWDTSAPSGSKTRKITGTNLREFFDAGGGVSDVNIGVPDIFSIAKSTAGSVITFTVTGVDQAANKLYFWDNTLNAMSTLGIGSGLSISGGNLTATASGSGTVTSIGLSAPSSMFSVASSPVTTSGTIGLSFANVSPNTIWAGPASGGAGATVNRAMVEADLPSTIDAAKITTGTFPTTRLGTGSGTSSSTILYGDVSGTPVWGPLPTGDVPSSRTLTAGDGLSGGGDLSANRSFELDLNELTEDASPDLSNDYAVFYDVSSGGHRKTKISNFTAPTSFPADPDIPAVLGWIETENVRKWMSLNANEFEVTADTNINLKLDTTLTNTASGVGLTPGMDIVMDEFISRDTTERWNAKSQAEGKDDDTIVKRGDEAVVYKMIWVDLATPTTGAGKVTFRAHKAFTITGVRLSLKTATSSGTFTVDINENGTSIFSTRPTIDQGEKTSVTAAVGDVISDADIADDSEITIDFDVVGTGGADPTVTIFGR